MKDDFSRTIGLIGENAFEKLNNSSVCIFGVGGVGSYATEALARAGIGSITVVDSDTVDRTNINRQLIALNSTIGKYKADVEKERLLDINPDCKVISKKIFYDSNSAFDLSKFDYIIDAIDSVQSKIFLIKSAKILNVPIISSMGTGNKIDPLKLKITDISKTSYCPLAKKMRYELKKTGIYHLKVVYSTEEITIKAVPPRSISFVPSVAGLLIASEVVRDLINEQK